MNIANHHYNEPKFNKVVLDGPIDAVDAKATAKMKNFRFEPSVVWPEDEEESTQIVSNLSTAKEFLDDVESAGPSGLNKSIPSYHKFLGLD